MWGAVRVVGAHVGVRTLWGLHMRHACSLSPVLAPADLALISHGAHVVRAERNLGEKGWISVKVVT